MEWNATNFAALVNKLAVFVDLSRCESNDIFSDA